jgi:hypothetical protein
LISALNASLDPQGTETLERNRRHALTKTASSLETITRETSSISKGIGVASRDLDGESRNTKTGLRREDYRRVPRQGGDATAHCNDGNAVTDWWTQAETPPLELQAAPTDLCTSAFVGVDAVNGGFSAVMFAVACAGLNNSRGEL